MQPQRGGVARASSNAVAVGSHAILLGSGADRICWLAMFAAGGHGLGPRQIAAAV
jgi:hypothetical protein